MNWQEIWQSIVNYFQSNFWNIVWFFIILALGIFLIPLFLFILKRILRRNKVDEIAIRFVATIIRFCLWLLLILLLLHILGVPITGLATGISAAILAIGMALKDFLSNIASGIILVGSKKYAKGDFVHLQAQNVEGSVEDINILFTTLHTPDNTQVTVPNNAMVNGAVINLHAYPTRRVAITFPVAFESDTKVVKETLLAVCDANGLIYRDPKPLCRLKTIDDTALGYFLTCFCDKEDYWDVYFYIMDRGYDALKAAGITVPFKQVMVSQHKDVEIPVEYDGLPERVEKKRSVTQKKVTMEDIEDQGWAVMKQETKRIKKDYAEKKKAAEKEEKAEAKAEKKEAKQKKKDEAE